eukprot:4475833-Pyramimonas_sp.AAC.1
MNDLNTCGQGGPRSWPLPSASQFSAQLRPHLLQHLRERHLGAHRVARAGSASHLGQLVRA